MDDEATLRELSECVGRYNKASRAAREQWARAEQEGLRIGQLAGELLARGASPTRVGQMLVAVEEGPPNHGGVHAFRTWPAVRSPSEMSTRDLAGALNEQSAPQPPARPEVAPAPAVAAEAPSRPQVAARVPETQTAPARPLADWERPELPAECIPGRRPVLLTDDQVIARIAYGISQGWTQRRTGEFAGRSATVVNRRKKELEKVA